jgi:DNA-binding NtrC family response regulator
MSTLPCNPRVLIVEDDPGFVALIQLMVKPLGATCVNATDADAAREELTSKTFEMVTIDLRLPDGGGPSLVAEIEGRGKDLAERCVILTSYPYVAKAFSTSIPIIDKCRVAEIGPYLQRLLAS